MITIKQQLNKIGLQLPALNQPAANYVLGVQVGNLIFISGQTPKLNGTLRYKGKVGEQLTAEDGYAAARLCALNCLAAIDEMVGLDQVAQIVRVTGYVNSAQDFVDQSKVINGASDLLVELFSERGKHARSAIGAYTLPGDAACEVELIVAIKN